MKTHVSGKRCCECRSGEHEDLGIVVGLCVVINPDTHLLVRRGYLCTEHFGIYDNEGYDIRVKQYTEEFKISQLPPGLLEIVQGRRLNATLSIDDPQQYFAGRYAEEHYGAKISWRRLRLEP